MLCGYGNCREEDTRDGERGLPVIVTVVQKGGGGERKRFCSEYHAALWLLGWASKREQNINRRMSAEALRDASYKE